MTEETTPTPVERAVDVLHQHIQATIATIAAGLPSDRAMRDVTGVTASCEQAVLGEVAHGGPLTRQGLDVAVQHALAAALDVDEIAEAAKAVTLGVPEGCGCDLPPMRLDDDAAFAVAEAVLAHLTGGAR